MKRFVVIACFVLSQQAFSQGCFQKCLDHLTQPLRSQEDVEARLAQSEKIIQNLVGCDAPDFNVKTITGESLSLKELRGKVIVANFWFEACAPCITEIPALNKLVEEYQNQEVVFIAFGKDPEARISKFLSEKKFEYKMVSGKYDVVNDFCVISGFPMNMVIDKEGVVRFIKVGGYADDRANSAAYDMLKPQIDEVLRR